MPKAKIFYHDIGDYLSREEKLHIIAQAGDIFSLPLIQLTPNEHGDWINQRNDMFATFPPIEPKKKFVTDSKSWFNTYAIGVATNRDAWVYGFSKEKVGNNMKSMIDFYNQQRKKLNNHEIDELSSDTTKISWTVNLKKDAEKNTPLNIDKTQFITSCYRPFCKCELYYHKPFIERPGLWNQLFPTPEHPNLVISMKGIGDKDFSCLICYCIPDLQVNFNGQCFPLYYYTKNESTAAAPEFNFDGEQQQDEYIRHDAITDFILKEAQNLYGKKVNKQDIFFYVYGFLHSPEYREAFAADLKKMLPRIPLMEKAEAFWAFSKAGKALAALHLGYESAELYEEVEIVDNNGQPVNLQTGNDSQQQMGDDTEIPMAAESSAALDLYHEYAMFHVEKMRFPNKNDKSTIIYNNRLTIKNIPAEAYDYVVNGKSAIEWIMERYAITTDRASGIKNDPNAWSREHEDPKYIFNLLLSVITVSIETMKIVKELPKVKFE